MIRDLKFIKNKQKGVISFVLIASIFLLLMGIISVEGPKVKSEAYLTNLALHAAKRELLSLLVKPQAMTASGIRVGELPCPDTEQDGLLNVPNDFLGVYCRSYIGWFPWNSFSSNELFFDGSESRLWYALSRGFENTANSSRLLNSITKPNLIIGEELMVALIFAPNKPLKHQLSRSHNLDISGWAQYLEIQSLSDLTASIDFESNDHVVGISFKEWRDMVSVQVLTRISKHLNQHYAAYKRYPEKNEFFVTLDTLISHSKIDKWIVSNGWIKLIDYNALDNNTLKIELNDQTVFLKQGTVR